MRSTSAPQSVPLSVRRIVRTASILLLAVLPACPLLFAADDEPLGGKLDFRPAKKLPIKQDDGSAERAIANFHVAPGLKVKLWAAEPMLANPNSLSVDEQGRVYVSEANRFKAGVIDVRETMSWLEEDIASKSVADRVAMVKKHANEKSGKEAIESTDAERVVLLQDTTGSGVANKMTVFTEGYNRIEDGLASGVFAYHGNVYLTCIPNLYQLKDTKGTGVADQRKVLSTGYGIRYAYIGHDLHGMVVGPDHRLYFSIGDRAASAEAIDGSSVIATECGSVFRCDLDGKNLELFATGLRNPQELRFDSHGNLFTGDNNPDKGDPARWVYVVEGGDSGWRIGYQHGEHPRDGGPWTAEQIFQTADHNNANYIVPPVSHAAAGPSGLVYSTGVGLPEKYKDTFFLCDYRGAANTSGIWALKNQPNGATFKLTNVDGKPIDRNTKITEASIFYGTGVVDVDTGPDGSLYMADWTQGWDRPMRGRVYRIVDESQVDSKLVAETKKLIGEGMSKKTSDELFFLLRHPDLRIRQEAQFVMAEKGIEQIPNLSTVINGDSPLVAKLHALWALEQIGRSEKSALAPVIACLTKGEEEVRCQAAKVIGDARMGGDKVFQPMIALAKSGTPRERYFAAMALGKIAKSEAIPSLVNLLKDNADKDPVLRYGAVWALAKIGDEAALAAFAKDPSPSVRLGAALALRKMESPEIAKFLGDSDRVVVLEAARAINDIPIDSAFPALAALADKPIAGTPGFAEKPTGTGPGPSGGPIDWTLWRVANAAYRLGTPEGAQKLATLASRTDVPADVRVEALHSLAEWAKPGNRDRITNLFRPLLDRDAKVAREAARPIVEKLADDKNNNVKVAAARLMQKYGLGDPATLASAVKNAQNPADVRLAALETLIEQKHESSPDLLRELLTDSNDTVRQSAIRKLATQPYARGLARLLEFSTNKRAPQGDRQAAIDALGSSWDERADAAIADFLQQQLGGDLPPELKLDVLDAAAKRKDPAVAALLKKVEATRDPKDPLADYRETLVGGVAENGRKTFAENAAVSCIRCHSVNGEGGVVGPALDGVGAKHPREYLLESIVVPSAQVAPGFESVQVQLTSGKYKSGIVKKEDEKELILLNADNELVSIPKTDIKSRERGPSVMPEGLHKVISKRELRDLVEYLTSLKTEAKPAGLKHGTK